MLLGPPPDRPFASAPPDRKSPRAQRRPRQPMPAGPPADQPFASAPPDPDLPGFWGASASPSPRARGGPAIRSRAL